MLGWDEELTELTPKRREEREKKEQEKYIRDGERGRRMLRGLVLLYLGIQIISIILGFLVAKKEGRIGIYIFLSLVQSAVTAAILRGLWHGRVWARTFLAVLLVFGMLSGGKEIAKLLLVQNEPQVITWGFYEDTLELQDSSTRSVFDYEKEVMEEYKEYEKQRVIFRKRMAAAYFVDIIICAGYLYFLYGYSPIKIFFEYQEKFGNIDWRKEEER